MKLINLSQTKQFTLTELIILFILNNTIYSVIYFIIYNINMEAVNRLLIS